MTTMPADPSRPDLLMHKLEESSPGRSASRASSLPADGTAPLLKTGIGILVAGILAAFATKFLLGGIGEHGPHTNTGWLMLIIAMMCLPFGSLVFLLGAAKWLRHQRLQGRS